MSYTLVLEWMPGDLYMSAVTARCTAPTSSYSVVWLPPNKVYQITLYCGSTSLVSFLVGAFRGKAWSYMRGKTRYKRTCRAFGLALLLLALLAIPALAEEAAEEEPQIFQLTEEDLTSLQVDLREEGEVSLSATTQEDWERMQREIANKLEQRLSSFTITNYLDASLSGEALENEITKLYFNTLYDYPEDTYFVATSVGYGSSGQNLYFEPVYLPAFPRE